ncbi:MAG: sigma-70 family RNA polymerase sigma factor [Clostridia bacterium]
MTLKKETIDLIAKAQSGDKTAENLIVEKNSGLIHCAIKHFLNLGFEYDDLYQCGSIGLIKSIRNFDISMGTAFSTYAIPLILGEIRKYIRDDGTIKASRYLKEANIKITRAIPRLSNTLGCDPTLSQLSEETGIDIDTIILAQNACAKPVSIDMTYNDNENDLYNFIGNDDIKDLADKITVRDIISSLSKLDRQIIGLRYFKSKTQAQTATLLGITQVKVSRHEKKIIDFLKTEFFD